MKIGRRLKPGKERESKIDFSSGCENGENYLSELKIKTSQQVNIINPSFIHFFRSFQPPSFETEPVHRGETVIFVVSRRLREFN